MMFKDRREAGQKLAPKLDKYRGNPKAVLLGLPRGGVVVAAELSRTLGLPLDVMVARKIGAPDNPEFAIGAITEDGEGIFDTRTIAEYNISKKYLDEEMEKEKQEALRRLKKYRGGRAPLDLKNKIAILIDDGVATGATMRAAIKSARKKGSERVVMAVPVIAPGTLEKIREEADEVIYLDAPAFFGAVGAFYEEFEQTEDEEVIKLMEEAKNIMKDLLFCTNANTDLAGKVSGKAGLELGKADVGKFSDGEVKVFLKESVEGMQVYALGSTHPPADNLLELLILTNTLKVNGAKKVTAVIPYFAYAKADHIDPPGAPLTAKMMPDFVKISGADRILAINLHSPEAEKFFGPSLERLDMIPALAKEFKKLNVPNSVVVSPDEGGIERANEFAKILNIKNIAYVKKYHPSLEEIGSRGIEGEVKGKNAVIVDDMVQSGETIINAVRELRKAGAENIYAAIVHLVSTGPGVDRLIGEQAIKEIIFTNTIPPNRELPPRFREVDVSDLIADRLKKGE
jgi:ribose-phosphate pyrophosphokinase